ncbi:MAG: FAD-dependent oxidoreductase [Bacteroidetes bacterium]|nr:FAD-dependent oxidoreductase [Bacteroidota bacterium]
MSGGLPIRIIGGGMTGLTLGYRLAQQGIPVAVHERDPYLGGLASESSLGGVVLERFYHCVLPTDTALLALLRELGIDGDVKWNRTRTGFFHDGRMIEMTSTADFLKFPALNVADRMRLAWTIGYCGLRKNWKRFDREPVSRFLRRHGGERLFTSIWEPLLLAKLGQDYDRFAASFIWATITRMLSARKQRDRSEKLGSIKGRYGKVFVALRSAILSAGGEVHTSSVVSAITGGTDARARWTVHADGKALETRGVVLCTPAPVAADLVGPILPDVAALLRPIEYLGVVCEVLLLNRALTPYYVLNLTDRRLPFTGIIDVSNLAGRDEFRDHTVIYLPRYAVSTSAVWEMSDEALHKDNVAGLKLVVPDLSEEDIAAWGVYRAKYVQPIHGVGKGGALPPVQLAPGLAYLSTAQIHPWPVFNDAVVRHIDTSLNAIRVALG